MVRVFIDDAELRRIDEHARRAATANPARNYTRSDAIREAVHFFLQRPDGAIDG